MRRWWCPILGPIWISQGPICAAHSNKSIRTTSHWTMKDTYVKWSDRHWIRIREQHDLAVGYFSTFCKIVVLLCDCLHRILKLVYNNHQRLEKRLPPHAIVLFSLIPKADILQASLLFGSSSPHRSSWDGPCPLRGSIAWWSGSAATGLCIARKVSVSVSLMLHQCATQQQRAHLYKYTLSMRNVLRNSTNFFSMLARDSSPDSEGYTCVSNTRPASQPKAAIANSLSLV